MLYEESGDRFGGEEVVLVDDVTNWFGSLCDWISSGLKRCEFLSCS